MEEPLIALRAKGPNTFKRWIYGVIQDLGDAIGRNAAERLRRSFTLMVIKRRRNLLLDELEELALAVQR